MTASTHEDTPHGPSWRVTAILAGIAMVGPFSIDTMFPAFALMQRDFAATPAAMQQVTSMYILTFGLMSVLHGPVSDALGRKRVMIAGMLGYTAATVLCALAPSLPVLLAGRALQGACAGAGTIVSRAVVRDMFAGPDAQRLMSRIMMIFSIAPALAPVLGGWILLWGDWPTIFWVIGGYGLLMAAAIGRGLPESLPPGQRTSFRLREMSTALWHVASSWRFERLAFAATFMFAAMFVWVVSAPHVVMDLLGLGEQDFLVLFGPLIAGMATGAWLSGRLADVVAPKRLITGGLVGVVASAVLGLGLTVAAPNLPWVMVGPALVAFFGQLAFPALQLALLDMFPDNRGSAASMGSFVTLMFNAALAGVISPLVMGSLGSLAATSLAFGALGLGLWAWSRLGTRRA